MFLVFAPQSFFTCCCSPVATSVGVFARRQQFLVHIPLWNGAASSQGVYDQVKGWLCSLSYTLLPDAGYDMLMACVHACGKFISTGVMKWKPAKGENPSCSYLIISCVYVLCMCVRVLLVLVQISCDMMNVLRVWYLKAPQYRLKTEIMNCWHEFIWVKTTFSTLFSWFVRELSRAAPLTYWLLCAISCPMASRCKHCVTATRAQQPAQV